MILTAGVMALAAQLALGQLRYFHGIGVLMAMRAQTGHASSVVARALWGVSPPAGDIAAALDSAIEFQATIGGGVVCQSVAGSVSIPQPRQAAGNALSAFWDVPEPGDRVHAFFNDSLGAVWLTLHVAAAPIPGGACPIYEDLPSTWLVALREPIAIPGGAQVRFTRPSRLSLYKAGDGRWYLGAKDWNSAAERFNTIQPVAGPLSRYNPIPGETGLLLVYRDRSGTELSQPADPSRIVSISVTSRAATETPVRVRGLATSVNGTYADSSWITIALRNASFP